MKRPLFTPEELAELEAFDAEVDAQPGYDHEEVKAQRRRDTEMRWDGLSRKERAIAEYQRAYREANKDAIAECQRAYYEANKDAIAERQRAYREANKDAIAEKMRAYYEANKDAIAEYQRAYYEANKDAIAERKRAYREANKDAIAERQRAYREANKDAIAERQFDMYHERTSDQNAEASPLRRWRRRNRLTQKDAAQMLGVTQPQISFYERGFTPIPASVMEAIS